MENSTKYSTRSRFIAIKQKTNQTSERPQTGREHVRWFILHVPIFFDGATICFLSFFSGDQVSESFREVGLVRHGQIND